LLASRAKALRLQWHVLERALPIAADAGLYIG